MEKKKEVLSSLLKFYPPFLYSQHPEWSTRHEKEHFHPVQFDVEHLLQVARKLSHVHKMMEGTNRKVSLTGTAADYRPRRELVNEL